MEERILLFLFEGGRLGINIKRKKGNQMARNLSIKQKNTYLISLAIIYILLVAGVYQIRVYDSWYLFVVTLVWVVLVLFYQKYLGIKFNREANYYLETIDKKYKNIYYLYGALLFFSLTFAMNVNIKFLILTVIAQCYQLYMTKRMIDYAY